MIIVFYVWRFKNKDLVDLFYNKYKKNKKNNNIFQKFHFVIDDFSGE